MKNPCKMKQRRQSKPQLKSFELSSFYVKLFIKVFIYAYMIHIYLEKPQDSESLYQANNSPAPKSIAT